MLKLGDEHMGVHYTRLSAVYMFESFHNTKVKKKTPHIPETALAVTQTSGKISLITLTTPSRRRQLSGTGFGVGRLREVGGHVLGPGPLLGRAKSWMGT